MTDSAEAARIAYDERCRCARVAKARAAEWLAQAAGDRTQGRHHLADMFTGRVEAAEALAFAFHSGDFSLAARVAREDAPA